jgi:hypothetical protein
MQRRLQSLILASVAALLPAGAAEAQTVNFTTPGVNTYTVPSAGYYTLSATGAEGGDGSFGGGTGATVSGNYYLNAGDQLTLILGVHGEKAVALRGGGGGGTGVVLNGSNLLLVAGGGGASGNGPSRRGYGGTGLLSTPQGGTGLGDAGGGGGYGAAGGAVSCSGSGGGAGMLTATANGGVACSGSGSNGGDGFGAGGAGGMSGTDYILGGGGGYAGGNAGMQGGGGGYSYYNPSGSNFTVTPGILGGGSTSSDYDGTASITPVPVTINTITGSPFIPGSSISIPFSTNATFNAGNVFTAQLSDAAGSFANPVNIGTLTATVSGTIPATLPLALRAGNGYLVRIVTSNPSYTSAASAPVNITEPACFLNLDGTSDYVVSASAVGISGVQPRTLEYYGYLSTGYQHQANWGTTSTNNAFGTFTTGGQLYFYAHDQNDIATGFSSDNQKHHVAVTYDGTHVRVYVDGNLTSAGAVARTLATVNGPLYIGARMDLAAGMSGDIDEVRVWNRALCQAEIQSNMNKMLPSPATQTGLALYYKFNQGLPGGTNSGISTVFDSSASANNGNMVNFAKTGSSSNFIAATFGNTAAPAFVAPLSAVNNTSTQTISGSTDFKNTCYVLSNVTPSGTSAVSGSVTSKVTIEGSVMSYMGNAYVQRHYDITPATNLNTATASITLYFTQGEFDAYNASNGVDPDLPTGPNDGSGAWNLHVTQFHGSSATSAPGSYSGYTGAEPPVRDIRPNSVTWNAVASRWEVNFNVIGFSGFFVAGRGLSGAIPLPVHLTAIAAAKEAGRNRIDWKVAAESAGTAYTVERSTDGQSFERIGKLSGTGGAGSYAYFDEAPAAGTNYYRLNIDEAGSNSFSRIVSVNNGTTGLIRVSPVPASSTVRIEVRDAAAIDRQGSILDMQGREMQRFLVQPSQEIDLRNWPSGIYSLKLFNSEIIRIVKQ